MYARVERDNRDFSARLFLLSLGCVLGAGMVAFLVVGAVDSHRTLWTVAILLLAGFVPPVSVAMVRGHRRSVHRDGRMADTAIVYLPTWVMMHMFEPVLVVALLVLVAIPFAAAATILAFLVIVAVSLISGPPSDRGEWPFPTADEVAGISAAVFVLVGLIGYLAEANPGSLLSPVQGVRELLVGLRLAWRRVLLFLVSAYAGLVIVGSGELGLVYAEWWQVAAAAGLAGVMLGYNLAPLPREEAVTRLIELGRIRCDIRVGRRYAARWRILQLHGQAWRHGSPGAWFAAPPSEVGELAVEVAECLGALVPQAPWGDPAAAGCWGDDGWGSRIEVGASFSARRQVCREWRTWRAKRIPRLLRKLSYRGDGHGALTGAWEASIEETIRLVEGRRPDLARSTVAPPQAAKRAVEGKRREPARSSATHEVHGAEHVIEHFLDRSDELLVREVETETEDFESLTLAWYIGPHEEGSPAGLLEERYGVFDIKVFKDEHALERELTRGGQVVSDERGIYWHVSEMGRFGLSCVAKTRYGNVVLSWYAGDERETDQRWERVNSILAELGERR